MQGLSLQLRRKTAARSRARGNRSESGIGVDADNKAIWIGSTCSREIIRADARTGETIEKHFTPGAGVIYRMITDLPPRPDTYGRSVRPPTANGQGPVAERTIAAAMQSGRAAGMPADGLGVGRGGAVAGNPGPPAPGTGARDPDTRRQAVGRRASGSDDLPD